MLLSKISHRFILTTKLFTGRKILIQKTVPLQLPEMATLGYDRIKCKKTFLLFFLSLSVLAAGFEPPTFEQNALPLCYCCRQPIKMSTEENSRKNMFLFCSINCHFSVRKGMSLVLTGAENRWGQLKVHRKDSVSDT